MGRDMGSGTMHHPAVIGAVCSIICVDVFGPKHFSILFMISILATPHVLRKIWRRREHKVIGY